MFSTGSSSTDLFARTNNGGSSTDTQIAGNWLGTPHRYRIEWNSASVVYFIDGVQVASHPITIGALMRPLISDFNTTSPAISVDWMRMSPYATPCTFESQVFDATQSVTWNTAPGPRTHRPARAW